MLHNSFKALRFVFFPLLGATFLLVLFEVHSSIIRRAQSLVGLRSDTPVIVATTDACGHTHAQIVALGARSTNEVPTDWLELAAKEAECNGRSDVLVATRPGEPISLWVNNELVSSRTSSGRIVEFEDIPKTTIHNLLRAYSSDDYLWMPYGSNFSTADFQWRERRARSVRPFVGVDDFLRVPKSSALGTVGLPGPIGDVSLLEAGAWKMSDGRYMGLVFGQPFAVSNGAAFGQDITWLDTNGYSGLAIADLDAGLFPKVPKEPEFFRWLSISTDETQVIEVKGKTCLPASHFLMSRIRASIDDAHRISTPISPEVFVARHFNVQIGRWQYANRPYPVHREAFKISDGLPTSGAQACLPVEVHFSVPDGRIAFRASSFAEFPNLPNDTLILNGFGDRARVSGRVANSADGDQRLWTGGADHRNPAGLSFWSSWSHDSNTTGAKSHAVGRGALYDQLERLYASLPGKFQYTLWALAALAPVALILWTVTKHQHATQIPDNERRGVSRGLIALVVFGLAFALQSYVGDFASWLLDVTQLSGALRDVQNATHFSQTILIPTALLVVMLAKTILDIREDDWDSARLRWLQHFVALAIATLLILLGLTVLQTLNFALDQGFASAVYANLPRETVFGANLPREFVDVVLVFALVLGWMIAGVFLFWIPVRWVMFSVTRSRRNKGAWSASILIFYVALLPSVTETFAQAIAVVRAIGAPLPFLQWKSIINTAEFVARYTPHFVLVLFSFLVVWRLWRIVLETLTPQDRRRAENWNSMLFWLLAAFLIVLPMLDADQLDQRGLQRGISNLLGLFQSYAPFFALMCAFSLLRLLQPQKSPGCQQGDPFALKEIAYSLCAAGFAGYVATWSLNPVSLLPVMVLGWFLFLKIILSDEAIHRPHSEDPTLGPKFVSYQREIKLAEQFERAAEKSFASGDLSDSDLNRRRNQANWRRKEAGTELSLDPEAVKLSLLGRGPMESPLENGMRGAISGLIFALLLQSLAPLGDSLESVGLKDGLLNILRLALNDPDYAIVTSNRSAPILLSVLSSILNSLTLWVAGGFLFGFTFHRIQGSNGFTKAIYFSLGVIACVLMSYALTGGPQKTAASIAAQIVPVMSFFLILGTLVFDGKSLLQNGLTIRHLVDVYGLKASVGYASMAGSLALLQPVLSLMD